MGQVVPIVFIRAYPRNPRSNSLVFVFPRFKVFATRHDIFEASGFLSAIPLIFQSRMENEKWRMKNGE
jgi:hypothetical protein